MNKIKKLRQELGLTLRDFSEKININYATLSRMESELQSISDDYLRILADFFNVSTDYLLGRIDIRNYDEMKDTQKHLVDETQFALYGEMKDMTDLQKQSILEIVRNTKKIIDINNKNGIVKRERYNIVDIINQIKFDSITRRKVVSMCFMISVYDDLEMLEGFIRDLLIAENIDYERELNEKFMLISE